MENRFKRRQTWNFIYKSHCAAAEAKEKVVSNEDLLTQILLHVPLRSLRKFKTVSKQWHSLITSSHFSLLLNNLPLRTSGVFLQRTDWSNKIIFIPLDDVHNHCRHDRPKALPDHPFYILQSCHGLLLLCSDESKLIHYRTYFVYNPSTNELATIRRNWHQNAIVWSSVLAYDPSKSPHYKIILCTELYSGDKVRIEVYSSETRNWSVSKPPTPLIFWATPVYFNSCIHWIDPDYSCVYYNVDEARLESLPSPLTDLHEIKPNTWMRMWESVRHLHVAALSAGQTSLDIYELKSDYTGWLFKYKVDFSRVFPELYNKDKCEYRVDVLSLVRTENCKEDSVLVILRIPGKIILYNLVDASFKQIWDFSEEPNAHFQAFNYIESLSSVQATMISSATPLSI